MWSLQVGNGQINCCGHVWALFNRTPCFAFYIYLQVLQYEIVSGCCTSVSGCILCLRASTEFLLYSYQSAWLNCVCFITAIAVVYFRTLRLAYSFLVTLCLWQSATECLPMSGFWRYGVDMIVMLIGRLCQRFSCTHLQGNVYCSFGFRDLPECLSCLSAIWALNKRLIVLLACSTMPCDWGCRGQPLTITVSPGQDLSASCTTSLTNSRPLSLWRTSSHHADANELPWHTSGVPKTANTWVCSPSATSFPVVCFFGNKTWNLDQWSMKCAIQRNSLSGWRCKSMRSIWESEKTWGTKYTRHEQWLCLAFGLYVGNESFNCQLGNAPRKAFPLPIWPSWVA